MILKKGFKSRVICGEFVLIPIVSERVDFNRLISMNETARFLWEHLQDREFQLRDMIDMILNEYDVTESQARTDCEKLLADWTDAGLVE